MPIRRSPAGWCAVVAAVAGCVAAAAPTATASGWTAYVGNVGSANLTPIDLTTNTARMAIPTGIGPSGVAIGPDGADAYVTNVDSQRVVPIDLATGNQKPAVSVGNAPFELAIAPDGRTAYVSDGSDDAVTPIDLITDTAGTEIPVGADPREIAITPDGHTAYVDDVTGNTVTPINLATDTPGPAIPVGKQPFGIAITPDGRTAYVTDYGDDAVTPIDLATDTPGAEIPAGAGPIGIAATPDGKSAYVVNYDGATVTRIDTATNTAVGTAIQIGADAEQIAITPDQAPTARLKATPAPAGTTTQFSGAGSTSPVGSIASYQWTFGDGRTATTTAPTIAHVYAKAGPYPVRLTVTNTAGTSTAQVFTGQTVSNQGGPSATIAHTVTIPPAGHSSPKPPPPGPGPAPVPPGPGARLTQLSISPASASIAGRRVDGRCRAPRPGDRQDPRCRLPVHLRLAYTVSASTTLTLTLARQQPGRRFHGRCVPPGPGNRHHGECPRLTNLPGNLTRTVVAGSHRLALSATFAGDRLGPGTYRLTAGPPHGATKTARFTITN